MSEITFAEELDMLHEHGKCVGAKIVSSKFLEEYFILGKYNFIVSFRKIEDIDKNEYVVEADKIVRFFNFWE